MVTDVLCFIIGNGKPIGKSSLYMAMIIKMLWNGVEMLLQFYMESVIMLWSGGYDGSSYRERYDRYGEYGASGGYADYSVGSYGEGSGGGNSYGGYSGYDIVKGTYRKGGKGTYRKGGKGTYRKGGKGTYRKG
eukprot:175617_1